MSSLIFCYVVCYSCDYHNNPNYWDRQNCVDNVDPGQMPQNVASDHRMWHLIRVYIVCHSSSNILDILTGSRMNYFKFLGEVVKLSQYLGFCSQPNYCAVLYVFSNIGNILFLALIWTQYCHFSSKHLLL